MKKVLDCENCKKEFVAPKETSKYCSAVCYRKHGMKKPRPSRVVKRIEANCKGCGNSFKYKETNIKKYCCFRCYRDTHRQEERGREIECSHCGDKFVKKTTNQVMCSKKCSVDSLAKIPRVEAKKKMLFCNHCAKTYTEELNRESKYCSTDCYYNSMAGETRESRRTGKMTDCTMCKKKFYVIKSRAEKGDRLYCSVNCHQRHVSEVLLGVPAKNHKSGFSNKVIYNGKIFRSTWEALYAVYLDEREVVWEYEKRRLPYVIGDKKHSYIPDFYLPETDEFIEIKGLYTPAMKNKMSLVMEQNDVNLVILQQKELIRKGVLPSRYAKDGVAHFIEQHPKLNIYN